MIDIMRCYYMLIHIIKYYTKLIKYRIFNKLFECIYIDNYNNKIHKIKNNYVKHLTNIYLNLYIKRSNISYLSPTKGILVLGYHSLKQKSNLSNYHKCRRFDTLRGYYPDELGKSTTHDFYKNGNIKDYCPNGGSGGKKECNTELDKTNAGCLWLFEQLFVKNKKNNINIVEYIMIWLSYKLNQKTHEGINNLNDFYTKYIENNAHYNNCHSNGKDCNNSLKEITEYSNYKEIIDKKIDLMTIGINDMSKFYDGFKSLCNMYTEFDEHTPDCAKYLKIANEFLSNYTNLNEDSNNIDGSSYRQVLCTLSNDYDNFKKKCNSVNCTDIPSLPPIKTTQNSLQVSEQTFLQNSDVISSSSIVNKLIPVLSIFFAIPIFWGISYKYSLFGFRKRSQKQKLREN
ncbi:hypothetical protein YYC_03531 [Plasmodium yoelii 17X]|uniref:Uncharacterized protein n=1 Tax=Plasmodium yoelii 17X TaxID=1323249 RepID=V7PI67_PLAYE|nr:hypothetical protein YYC_03531 [Plasmodium yoelii 17X]